MHMLLQGHRAPPTIRARRRGGPARQAGKDHTCVEGGKDQSCVEGGSQGAHIERHTSCKEHTSRDRLATNSTLLETPQEHTTRDTSGAHIERQLRSTHRETPPTRSTLVQTPPAPNHHASSHTSQNNLKIRFLTVLIVCWRPPPSDASSVCVCVFLLGVGVVWEECGWV